MTFEEKLNQAYRKCWTAYERAENALNKITVLLQKKYPTLEATISGDEIFFLDMASENRDEYYSLEDIEKRYKEDLDKEVSE